MLSRITPRVRIAALSVVALVTIFGLMALFMPKGTVHAANPKTPVCKINPAICTETQDPWSYDGTYTGHDEPSVLFYSNTPGSGTSNLYRLTLPTQPVTKPVQDGTGSTWDFQLHPAFWFGMAMCDDQSGPNPGGSPA